MSIKKMVVRLFRRLFYCKHHYMPHRMFRDGRRMRHVWKCTKCGREYTSK